MQNPDTSAPSTTAQGQVHEEMWFLAQAPLPKYLYFADDLCADSAEVIRPALVREWSAAKLYYEELADTEAGIADHLDWSALPPPWGRWPRGCAPVRSTHAFSTACRPASPGSNWGAWWCARTTSRAASWSS